MTGCVNLPDGHFRSAKRSASATKTNYRNQGIARRLQSFGRIYCDAAEATDGAALADGGVNPIIKVRVVDPTACHYALAVMTTAGWYETSGDGLYDIGLPGKTAVPPVSVPASNGTLALSRLWRSGGEREPIGVDSKFLAGHFAAWNYFIKPRRLGTQCPLRLRWRWRPQPSET